MDAIVTFCQRLFGHMPEGSYVLLWTLPDKRSRFVRSAHDLAELVRKLAPTHDVYVGVGLRGADLGPTQRGSADEVIALTAFVADIDFADPVHRKPNLPPDEAAAWSLIATLPLAPTLVVHSGHGLQTWWVFSEPYAFSDAADRARVAAIARGWHERVRAVARARGWDVDAVYDLTRVLRVPGTLNHKNRSEPVPVQLVEADGPQYGGPSDFADHVALRPGPGNRHDRPLAVDPNAQPPADKFAALLQNDRKFRLSWDRQRKDLQDQSPSAYDMSLAALAARAGWTDEEITALLVAARRRHGDDLKRPDYYQRTITRARTARSEAELVATAHLAEITDRDAKLATIRQYLQAPIAAVIRRNGDDGRKIYVLRLDDGTEITLGRLEEVEQQRATRGKISDVTRQWFPTYDKPKWETLVQFLVEVSEDDIIEEAMPSTEVWEWVMSYVGDTAPADWRAAFQEGDPFILDGNIYLTVRRLRKHLYLTENLNINTNELRLRLRSAGFCPKSMSVWIDGKTYCRRYWCAPAPATEEARGEGAADAEAR